MKPFATIGIALSSNTTTASSAPAMHISTFGLRVVLLVPFRFTLHRRFASPSATPAYSSCHLHTGHPHSLYFQAEHLCSSPGGLRTRLLNGIFVHFDASAMVLLRSTPISAPDAFVSTLPFRPSIQHHSHWRAAPGRGLVSAPDSSVPMDQS